MFEKDFKKFLKKWEEPDFIFLARPDQRLADHISNIFIELRQYLKSYLSFSTQINKVILISIFISVITHDFGKILPHFQYKIFREINRREPSPIPNSEIKFSYHTLISALFSMCLCDIIYNSINSEEIPKNARLGAQYKISEDEISVIKYLSFNTVLSHHSPYIIDNYILFIGDFRSDDFKQIFSYIRSIKPNIHKFFEDLKEKIYLSDKNIGNNTVVFYDLYQNQLIKSFKKAYIKFDNEFLSINPQNPLDPSIRYKIKEVFNKIEDIKNSFNSYNSIDLYVLQIFIASLLCDLDIWDARFFPKKNAKNHEFPFFPPLEKVKDKKIIANFVSKPFSEFCQDFKEFKPEIPKNVIYELRNELFRKANREELKAGKVYLLSSPTGAGKTLTLLNLAVKLSYKYEKTYNFRPKIIYGLPFISIGSQVAKQISDIFENKANKKLLSSSLLTIDNYVSDISWKLEHKIEESKLHEEEIKMIYGKDAKWLISTWRSEFIVTTFVKIFNSLLKPFKNNYLKFHRLANSVIILDEVQCLPIKYWGIIGKIINIFSQLLNSTFILSTATLPAIISKEDKKMIAKDHLKKMVRVPAYSHEIELGQAINRYTIYYFKKEILLTRFIELFMEYANSNPDKDILLVLNTKGATIKTFLELSKANLKNTEIELLSTLVLPKDRQDKIGRIKSHLKQNAQLSELSRKQKRIIVISTQVIEAGVDFSFSVVFRDFAPLDSIIQVAGRCNRNLDYEKEGYFFLIKLIDPLDKKERLFFHQIYKDNMVKDITDNFLKKASNQKSKNHKIFGEYFEIEEPKLRSKFNKYFNEIVKPNTTSTLFKELKKLKFNLLSQKFDLIEGYPNQVDLFIPIDMKASNIHKGLINNKLNAIPNKFYRYTVNINENILYNLQARNIIGSCLDNKKVLYYYLKEEYISEWYNKKTGFIYNLDTANPQPILKNKILN